MITFGIKNNAVLNKIIPFGIMSESLFTHGDNAKVIATAAIIIKLITLLFSVSRLLLLTDISQVYSKTFSKNYKILLLKVKNGPLVKEAHFLLNQFSKLPFTVKYQLL
jgi:hypothetical protein